MSRFAGTAGDQWKAEEMGSVLGVGGYHVNTAAHVLGRAQTVGREWKHRAGAR